MSLFIAGMICQSAIVFLYLWAAHGDMLQFRQAWSEPDESMLRPWFRVVRRLVRWRAKS